MKILLIIAHPNPESFNHVIAKTAYIALINNNHTVWYRDLYQERFDPVLPACEISRNAAIDENIFAYCSELTEAEGIIIIHPNWWGQPPAILKGWVDRVIRPGTAYRFIEGDSGEGVPIGLLKAKSVIVFNTSNTIKEREDNVFGDPLNAIWKDCIFGLCGVTDFHRHIFRVVVTSDQDIRSLWLSEVTNLINKVYPKKLSEND